MDNVYKQVTITPCTSCGGSCVKEETMVVNYHDYTEKCRYVLCNKCDGVGLLVTTKFMVNTEIGGVPCSGEKVVVEPLNGRKPKDIYGLGVWD